MSRKEIRICDACGKEQIGPDLIFGRSSYSTFTHRTPGGSWDYDLCPDCACKVNTLIHNEADKNEV
jgi:hypothetical protein